MKLAFRDLHRVTFLHRVDFRATGEMARTEATEAQAASSQIRANTASCTASDRRWRVTVKDEWSGTDFLTSSPRNSRSVRLSLHRHAIARCPSSPSKYPTTNIRK
jgi:hypothetical protein